MPYLVQIINNKRLQQLLWQSFLYFPTEIQAHDSSVRGLLWSHNEQWMLSGDHGGFVKYWQMNMNNVKMYQAHKDPIRGLRLVTKKGNTWLQNRPSFVCFFVFMDFILLHSFTLYYYLWTLLCVLHSLGTV